MLEVVAPGVLATIQDAGRAGYEHLGVPRSGACDPEALAIANALLGNRLDAPALEVTLGGFEAVAIEACAVALAGADLGARLVPDDRHLPPGTSHLVARGARLLLDGGNRGARAYLALAGGIEAELVLGSASTFVPAGLGGIEGRAVRAGDRLVPVRRGDHGHPGRAWPVGPGRHPGTGAVSLPVLRGPHADRFATSAFDVLTSARWTVAAASDRVGIRLAGPSLEQAPTADLVSCGVTWGAVQVASDGVPIVLAVDHQTVGGYPVLAVVASVARGLVGQLRPGEEVAFEEVSADEAVRRLRRRAAGVARAMAVLAADGLWDRLADEAGG